MRLYLLTSAEGMPLMWCVANPELGERDVTAMCEIDHHLVAGGQVILAMAAAIWHNTKIGATSKRSPIAYDH